MPNSARIVLLYQFRLGSETRSGDTLDKAQDEVLRKAVLELVDHATKTTAAAKLKAERAHGASQELSKQRAEVINIVSSRGAGLDPKALAERLSDAMEAELKASPWLKMFQNAHDWCVATTK